ncbi:MAG: hypothetical protein HY821_13030 [Acidobacteria bacterium]|nr:hypothetical protein [Acidobacteriota bacterium]
MTVILLFTRLDGAGRKAPKDIHFLAVGDRLNACRFQLARRRQADDHDIA